MTRDARRASPNGIAQRQALASEVSGHDAPTESAVTTGIDLYWLPLGAGGQSVRLNGRIFEAVAARLEQRSPCDLYHSALEVRVPEGRFVIEQAPVRDSNGAERGVVAEGAVGSGWAGRFRISRYEVRRWRGGIIPDIAEAVDSPRRVSGDVEAARCLLELVPQVPTPVWGRDELHAGEMWNSNSVISWLIARSWLDVESIQPPRGGRAPGWAAGIEIARRQQVLELGLSVQVVCNSGRLIRANRLAAMRAPVACRSPPSKRRLERC
jgi:hypothetical protein